MTDNMWVREICLDLLDSHQRSFFRNVSTSYCGHFVCQYAEGVGLLQPRVAATLGLIAPRENCNAEGVGDGRSKRRELFQSS